MSPSGTRVAAVDFGATSVRVCVVDVDAAPLAVEVVHRVAHEPVREPDGSLRWRWDGLVAEMERGLELARAGGPLASIGVCTWGVDYGLIDATGSLLSPPHCYRSTRTSGFLGVVDRVGDRRRYEISGVQLQPFNTIFQLAAHDRDELVRAHRCLLLPDLLVHHLTGAEGAELTAAGTTSLLDIATRSWSDELIGVTGAARELFPEIVEPATRAGTWRGVDVHRVGGHDTASAVAATSGGDGVAFVSSGTWMLVGREQPSADTSIDAQADNFTNEIAVDGNVRFLKNLAGFWLVEECRRVWGIRDGGELLREAADARPEGELFDTADRRFLAPADMGAEIRSAAGLPDDAPRGAVVRAAVESMAQSTAAVLERLGGIRAVSLVGGGAGLRLLTRALERRTGLPVYPGPAEATALGNALVQGVALGRWPDLAAARSTLTHGASRA